MEISLIGTLIFILEYIQFVRGLETGGCIGQNVEIKCYDGEYINVEGELYGLSAFESTCSPSEGDICVIPSHSHGSTIKRLCNGHSICNFTINETRTCLGTEKVTNYHHVKYQCIQEESVKSICQNDKWVLFSGYLSSPNYPERFPSSTHCTCSLSTKDGSMLTMRTLEFNIPRDGKCRNYLSVITDESEEQILCGNPYRTLTAREVVLTFSSVSEAGKGFLLLYEATNPEGIIKVRCSDISPGKYKSSTKPTLPGGNTVTELMMTTEKPNRLAYIVEQITKKPQTSSVNLLNMFKVRMTTEFRTATETTQYTTTKTKATMIDRSSTVTFEEHTTPSSPPTSPTTTTTVPTTQEIITSTININLKVQTVSGCFGDIVHFHCKENAMIRVVDDMYGYAPDSRCTHHPDDCVVHSAGQRSIVSQICSSKSRCRDLIITRQHCNDRVTSYQQITYECVPIRSLLSMCQRLAVRVMSGYISTPNFPEPYPKKQSCSCSLQSEGGKVELTVAHFSLHDGSPCDDWLDVHVGDTGRTHRLCGTQHGHFVSNYMTINFHSNHNESRPGIWLHFAGTNNSSVFLACNVPMEKYFSPPVRSTIPNYENWSWKNMSTTTVRPSVHTMPSKYSQATTSDDVEKMFNPTATQSTFQNYTNTAEPSQETKSNRPIKFPVGEHILRHKTKQKTQIKANVDETQQHSISGFEMIETFEEEEEWVERSNVVPFNPTTEFNSFSNKETSGTTDVQFNDKSKFTKPTNKTKTVPNRTKLVRLHNRGSSAYSSTRYSLIPVIFSVAFCYK